MIEIKILGDTAEEVAKQIIELNEFVISKTWQVLPSEGSKKAEKKEAKKEAKEPKQVKKEEETSQETTDSTSEEKKESVSPATVEDIRAIINARSKDDKDFKSKAKSILDELGVPNLTSLTDDQKIIYIDKLMAA